MIRAIMALAPNAQSGALSIPVGGLGNRRMAMP